MKPAALVSALSTRARHVPPEWAVALLFSCVGLGVLWRAPFDWAGPDVQIYRQLAAAFVAGFVVMISVACGHALLLALPASTRSRWRDGCLGLASALALAAYLFVKAPYSTAILRLLEAAALGAFVVVAALGVFLPLAGILRWREFTRVAGRCAALWTPILLFNVFGGFCITAVRISNPLVWDPALLRMDLSLGLNPSQAVYAWCEVQPWLYPLSDAAYPLLGLMIAGVMARLQIAQEFSQTRRALLAVLLVGVLGIGCYQLVPAVGPVHAFPALYEEVDGPVRAELALERVLSGPGRIAAGPELARNVVPSLHTAFTLVVLAAAWSWRRRFFWQCLPLGALQIATTLTLAVHYLVDLIAAVPLAALCWWLADRGVRRAPRAGDEPLPSLAHEGRTLAVRTRVFWGGLAGSVGGLLAWAWFAPLHPALAWPLAVFCVAAPTWAGLRLNRHVRPASLAVTASGLSLAAPTAWRVRLLFAGVFCSGGVALVLEQIYEKYLTTLLGASRPASTIVLAVYFAGLALGAWLCPKRFAGAPRRLAALELFIAAWAALVGVAFFACDRILGGWLAAADGSVFTLMPGRASVAILWILPPTLAMGAQLPTLAAVLCGHPMWRGLGVSRFYAVNLAGAFVFTLLTPALLFNTVGADGALWAIAALGGVVGLALWFGLPPAGGCADAEPGPQVIAPGLSSHGHAGLLTGAFAAGFGGFSLEVVWFHLISAVCGASTYSFSLLLALVLLGLALGGARVRRISAAGFSVLAPILGWLVVALALGSALWPWAGFLMAREQAVQAFEWFWAGEAIKFGIIALVVLPSAVLAGTVFPLLLRGIEEQEAQKARRVGAVCGWNVVGCVAGALVTGFGFIPAMGAERTLQVIALMAGVFGLGLGLRQRPVWVAWGPAAGGVVLLLCLPAWNRLELTAGYGVYLRSQLAPGAELTFFREDFTTGFVTVVETDGATRVAPVKRLLQNGKFDADDGDEMPAQIGFGLVAALHAPGTGRALVIGAGSGQTASVIARLGFDHVDIAELSAAHLEAARAKFGHINARVFDRPNVSVHIEDGRNLLLRTPERYDLIQIELSSIWFAGATNLYSREFYALARERLSPGGVLVQWIQLHHLTPREIACVLATARAEFGDVSVWRAGSQACLLASDRPPGFNAGVWRTWLRDPGVLEELLITGLVKPEAFAATQVLPGAGVDALLARTPYRLNTDRNRWLEFQTPKYYLSTRDHAAENLRWLTGRE